MRFYFPVDLSGNLVVMEHRWNELQTVQYLHPGSMTTRELFENPSRIDGDLKFQCSAIELMTVSTADSDFNWMHIHDMY